MKILILNQDWFVQEFREWGHEVFTAGIAEHLDIRFETPLVHIDRIIELAWKGEKPDRIVVYDNSAPLMVQGLDETVIPTIFYSVDTHHHIDLHKYFAHLFDSTLVAQKDYIQDFLKVGYTPEWFPLWASRMFDPSEDKQYGAVFIGALNPKLNPDRVKFFEGLKKRTDIHFQVGRFWEIFPHAEIVVNQTVKGDLNFRVFEAMMSGAALLTERSPNGLFELFKEEEHLVTYTKNDIEDAAQKIEALLADKARCRAIGKRGREEIFAHHLTKHRAERLLSIIEATQKRKTPLRFLAAMANFATFAARVSKIDTTIAARACVAALKAADYAFKHGEVLDNDIACFLILACVSYERHLHTGAGDAFILEVAERQPSLETLALAKLRILLNRGDIGGAKLLASSISMNDHEDVFMLSEKFVSDLVAGVDAH